MSLDDLWFFKVICFIGTRQLADRTLYCSWSFRRSLFSTFDNFDFRCDQTEQVRFDTK